MVISERCPFVTQNFTGWPQPDLIVSGGDASRGSRGLIFSWMVEVQGERRGD